MSFQKRRCIPQTEAAAAGDNPACFPTGGFTCSIFGDLIQMTPHDQIEQTFSWLC